MASVGASAAQGLQAGWQMGMQADEAELRRQTTEDSIRQRDREFGLREKQYADQQSKLQTADEYNLLGDEHKQLLAERAAMEAAGQAPTPEFNQRVIQNRSAYRAHVEKRRAPMLAAEHAEAQRFFADLQAGNVDPSSVDPAKFYRNFSVATRMTPKDLAAAVQGAQLVQQGHETGNQQILLQGVNQLVSNDLKAGVGSTSPHGGVVTRKEIVGLIPVKDANGVEHPDKVFPLVRTYVMHPNSAGDEDYYDAPLTQNRSSDPNDPPKAVDLAHAFDYMGKLGALAQVMQHPEVAAKLAEGEKLVGAQTQADVDEMNALGKRSLQESAKGAVAQKLQLIFANIPPGPERDKAVAQTLGAAPSADTVARVESAEKVAGMKIKSTEETADKRIASAEKVAAGHDATRVKVKGMGGSTGSGSGAGTAGGYTDVLKKASPGERLMAGEWLATGKSPGIRKADDLMRLSEIRAALMNNAGLTLKDVVQQGDTMKLTSGAVSELEKMHAAVESFSSTAKANMKVLEDLSSKLPRSDIPIISKGQLAIESFTGNPVLSQYQGAMASVTAEVSRILNQPRLVGQLTDSARHETQQFLNGNMTHRQLVELFKTLRVEMANREQGIVDMKNVLLNKRTEMAGKLSENVSTGMGAQPTAPSKADEDLINKWLKK